MNKIQAYCYVNKNFIRNLLSAFVKSNGCLTVTYCVPGTVLSPLHTLLHQILALLSPHFTGEAERG